ncbi:MAG: FAD-dependent oxidoreductase, partial [Planctomycetota bacterium]
MNGLAARGARARTTGRDIRREQFELGTTRGSSHGAARIARSTYHDPEFARLMQEALRDDWPRLEADAGETLLHRTPGCIFGPEDGEIATYERACAEAGVDVRRVDSSEARRLFPAFDLDADSEDGSPLTVLSDETAAVVAAART